MGSTTSAMMGLRRWKEGWFEREGVSCFIMTGICLPLLFLLGRDIIVMNGGGLKGVDLKFHRTVSVIPHVRDMLAGAKSWTALARPTPSHCFFQFHDDPICMFVRPVLDTMGIWRFARNKIWVVGWCLWGKEDFGIWYPSPS